MLDTCLETQNHISIFTHENIGSKGFQVVMCSQLISTKKLHGQEGSYTLSKSRPSFHAAFSKLSSSYSTLIVNLLYPNHNNYNI